MVSYEHRNALSNVMEGRYLTEKLSDHRLSTTDCAPWSHTGWFRTYQNKNSHYHVHQPFDDRHSSELYISILQYLPNRGWSTSPL